MRTSRKKLIIAETDYILSDYSFKGRESSAI